METIVTVLLPTEERHRRLLESSAPHFSFRYTTPEAVTQEELDHTDVLIGNPPPQLLHGSPRLQWIQSNNAGVEPFLQPGVLHPNTLLTNATWAYYWKSLKSCTSIEMLSTFINGRAWVGCAPLRALLCWCWEWETSAESLDAG